MSWIEVHSKQVKVKAMHIFSLAPTGSSGYGEAESRGEVLRESEAAKQKQYE